jgi:hypothetical protein
MAHGVLWTVLGLLLWTELGTGGSEVRHLGETLRSAEVTIALGGVRQPQQALALQEAPVWGFRCSQTHRVKAGLGKGIWGKNLGSGDQK